ncbi:MAG TPA: hypothetical protein DCG48_08300, partial [Rhodospirillaceae bacterium]|nr:hypothetical protein [Rhodospirillaceae bacterium]
MPDTTDIDPRSDANASSPQDAAAEDAKRLKARKRRFVIAVVIGVVGTLFGGLEIHDRVTNIHEVDARIGGDLITVSSRVAGWVTEIAVTEGDNVEPGSVLVAIDDRESKLKARELEAQIASLRAEKDRTIAERRLVDKETAAKLKSEQAILAAAQVTVSSLQPQLALAQREHERAQSLFEKRVASRR